MPGGVPHPDRVLLGIPKSYQIKEELGKAGYSEERARIFSQKSGGDLSLLLRCIQNISLMPGWAQNTTAADLAIVEFLGAWDEKSEADKKVAEILSKKAYGEWIKNIREIARHPGTPLMMRDGKWKFVARYEGWYALGPNIFDEHLDQLKEIAVSVLRERDPKFDLPPDERFAASIHGKVFTPFKHIKEGVSGKPCPPW